MEKKLKRLAVLLLSLTLLLASCSAGKPSTAELSRIDAEETYPNGMYSLVVTYDSLEELYASSVAVVSCRVSAGDVVDLDGIPQTHSTLQIDQVIKGTVPEQILLIEEGSAASYFGVPPVTPGSSYVLFLVDSGLPQYENSYCVAGAFQGKFIEREGYYFQQATQETKLPESEYFPVPLEELTQTLKQFGE